MKLAFNEVAFEAANTGNLKRLLADVQLSGYPLNIDNWQAIEPVLYAEPNGNNNFRFLVQKILKEHSLLTPGKPEILQSKIAVVANHLAKVRLAYRTSPVVYSSVVQILGGGSSDADLLGNMAIKKRFLTHQPNRKVVDTLQRDWLYWLHDSANYSYAVTTLNIVYELTYDDDSSGLLNGDSIVVSNNIVEFCVPIGYWAIAVAEESGKSIVSWSVKLVDNTGITVSEKRVYLLAPPQDEAAKYLVFRNSLNVFDSVRFDGSYAGSFETSTQTAVNGNEENFDFDSEGYETLKLNTGRLGRGWLAYLKEMMLSDEIYLLEGGKYKKLVKLGKSINGVDSSKRDDIAVLEFRVAKTETYS